MDGLNSENVLTGSWVSIASKGFSFLGGGFYAMRYKTLQSKGNLVLMAFSVRGLRRQTQRWLLCLRIFQDLKGKVEDSVLGAHGKTGFLRASR